MGAEGGASGPTAGAQRWGPGASAGIEVPAGHTQHQPAPTRGDNPASETGSPQTQLYTESLRWQEKHNGKDKLKVAWQTLFSF